MPKRPQFIKFNHVECDYYPRDNRDLYAAVAQHTTEPETKQATVPRPSKALDWVALCIFYPVGLVKTYGERVCMWMTALSLATAVAGSVLTIIAWIVRTAIYGEVFQWKHTEWSFIAGFLVVILFAAAHRAYFWAKGRVDNIPYTST